LASKPTGRPKKKSKPKIAAPARKKAAAAREAAPRRPAEDRRPPPDPTIQDRREVQTVQLSWAKGKAKAPGPGDPLVAERLKITRHSELSAVLRFSSLARQGRPAFLPETALGDGGALDSKVGGTPWLPAGEAWPGCPGCSQPMQLMVQLNLETLASGALGSSGGGLLQVFYCTSTDPLCEMDTDAGLPGPGRSKLVRVVHPSGAGAAVRAPAFPGLSGTLASRRIVGLKSIQDFPDFNELTGGLIALLKGSGVNPPDYANTMPFDGDKLGGFPRWTRMPAYPRCPSCQQEMSELVVQLASGGVVGWQWGDRALAYVLRCPDHPERVELVW